MRVLAAADVHGQWPVYDWLLRIARERAVDAVVLAGDLLGCPDEFETPEEARQHDASLLVDRLGASDLRVMYIMGNDDLVELQSRCERLKSLHGRRVVAGGCGFVGYQCTLPFMGGTFERTEAGIALDLEGLAGPIDARTVVVSHSPAHGLLDPGFSGMHGGSRSLREFLEAHPFLAHIHGHSHSGFGRDGRHFNVACGGRTRAMILDLESLRHEVLGPRPQQRDT